jgi:hypothetical protein
MPEIVQPGALRLGVTNDWRSKRTDQTKLDTNSPEWRALRQKVLDRDNYKCQYCGFRARAYQIVHHLDGTPDNHAMENLTTTCQACNCIVHCGFASAKGWLTLIKTTMSQAAIVMMCRDVARQAVYGLKEGSAMAMLELAGYERVMVVGNQVHPFALRHEWEGQRSVATYANFLLTTDNAMPEWGKDLKGLFTAKFDRWQTEFEF